MARRVQDREIEILPEADRLEGFAHPRETETLFGHRDAIETLADGFNSGRMHHAWIVAGPAGIGKATLLYRFARFVLADMSERTPTDADPLAINTDSTACRQVRSLSHPRLLLIRRPYDIKAKRFSSAIPVDAVRNVRGFLSSRGDATHWRVVIVDAADEMNINAANALLKSLEEPPPRTVFLLVASEPGRLINTIRSRCRRMNLGGLHADELKSATQKAIATAEADAITDAAFDKLLPLAGGSVRRVLSLHALKGAELAGQLSTILERLPAVDWAKVHKVSDELAPVAAAERFEMFFDLLLGSLHAGLRLAANAHETSPAAPLAAIKPPQRLIETMARAGNLDAWAAAWEEVVREKAQIQALNLDRKAFIVETVSRLARTAAAG